MGEVYRARDPKLGRDVAIKVLPDRLAQDPAALARFEREARAVAALSHPNILAIFDFGTESGVTYASPSCSRVDAARAISQQRAAGPQGHRLRRPHRPRHRRRSRTRHRPSRSEAREHLHHQRRRGEAARFGLAKTAGPEGQAASGANGGADTAAADTTPGTVLGTVGYMSPEQVRGLPTDHRTDIFSFGAVFYEMLTGRRPFRGDSHVETMNAILKEDPAEFTDVAANVPGSVERIIRRCLEKQPADRFHSAHDLAISLEALSGSSNSNQSSASIAAAALPMPVQEKGRRLNPLLAPRRSSSWALRDFMLAARSGRRRRRPSRSFSG
jgi:serine/threonine protein kinase